MQHQRLQLCRNTLEGYNSAETLLQNITLQKNHCRQPPCRNTVTGYSSAGTPMGSIVAVDDDLATRADLKVHLQGSLIHNGEGSLALLPQHYPA